MKSSDNGEQCEEKESNRRRSHVSFDHFLLRCRPYPTPLPRPLSARIVTRSLSSRCLSFSAQPPFCTYVSLSIVVISFTMFFLVEKHTCGPGAANASPLRGAKQRERFPRRRVAWKEPLTTTLLLRIFVILISPGLDNLVDGLRQSIFFSFLFNAIFLRNASGTERVYLRTIRKVIFLFLRGYEVPQW